jgi:riboflavin kinase / FMN adenylyltransferase
MMVIRKASELQPGTQKVCAAIGVFDGVHLGHQQVLRQTLADARHYEGIPVAITFDRHPATVVTPERAPKMILRLEQKLAAITQLGFDHIYLIPFDEPFSRITGAEFITGLATDFGSLASICVGSAFTFGHRRSGDVGLLKELGARYDFKVHGLAAVALDGQPVSSTRIRSAIGLGELDAAGQMLGRAYTIGGPIIRGAQLGRLLGFPTANIDTENLITPPHGVYAAHLRVGTESYRAALNIGVRPTVDHDDSRLHVEAHLLDFSADLYGQDVEITIVEHLRPEQKFPNLDALKTQISADVDAARRIFG